MCGVKCVVCEMCSVVCRVVCRVSCVVRGVRGVCRFKTSACFEHARVLNHTRKRFEPTHGSVSNLHTGRREGGGRGGGGSLLFLSLVPSLSFSLLVSLSFSLSSLGNNDNDHSFSRFSL